MSEAKLSLFKNNKSDKPYAVTTLEQFVEDVKNGKWKVQVLKLRESDNKKLKDLLPAITISGNFKTREKNLPLNKKLIAHSGFICIDIDTKDNPKMSTAHVIDHECVAQLVSCRGGGLKIVYKCKPVTTLEEHWRIYDAIEQRLLKKRINIKVDSIVKSIASLQYVTYDPEPYTNYKTKLVVKPLPPIKIKSVKTIRTKDTLKEIETLQHYIDELGTKDITQEYEDWNNLAFGLSYSLGEDGRALFHKLSCNYKGYSKSECDEKYDHCLQRSSSTVLIRPVTLATVYDILAQNVSAVKIKQLKKVKGVAVGPGEGQECPDLAGMVRYKLFLFKKVLDTKTFALKALIPHSLNLIAFGDLLKAKNFFRYELKYVRISNNIVEVVDIHTILWEVSEFIKADGDYSFNYKGEQFFFSWEDIYHLWKVIKASAAIHNTVPSDIVFWKPNLLKDTVKESFIPYQNGVVRVTSNNVVLLQYAELTQEIWKEHILPRDFKYTKEIGMFENFFANVIGRGKNFKSRVLSPEYKRGHWYFGYMLQGTKDPATARAWMLYDINAGNNGRSGKSIMGQALGYIRYVTLIDGKQVDFRNRFWLQTIKPWTKIIFIDDPRANTSLLPMFNMITGTVTADRKGLIPLEIDAKFAFASNWIMESDGTSEADRQFISQLENYYTEYAKKHGDTITPIVHAHGKRFFTEWNEKDWSQFDSFCIRALQYHLGTATPNNLIIGDSKAIAFVQRYGEETFADMLVLIKKHGDIKNKTVPREVLVNYVRETDATVNAKNAGTIVRGFLKAVGCGNITVTTSNTPRGIAINVYKWDGSAGKLEQ